MKRRPRVPIACITLVLALLGCQIGDLVASNAPTATPQKPVAVAATLLPSPTTAPPTSPPPTLPPPTIALPTLPFSVIPTGAAPVVSTAAPTPPALAPATATRQSPCTIPNASITSPGMDEIVSGLLEIHGTATHPNLGSWKVEYRPDASTAFMVLSNGDKGVTDAVLARLSTKTVPNGVYWLQLMVIPKDGNYGNPCQIRIVIAN